METEDFAVGQKVRLVRSAEPNSMGTVEQILEYPAVLPSGLRAASARVSLENGGTVTVPLANLEILT